MMVWYMTVFPTVRKLAETRGCRGVFLFEDTCLLAEGVDYRRLALGVDGCVAGVFGYGGYERKRDNIRWHGAKGLHLTPEWCEPQQIMFENMHVSRFWHVDNWLAARVARGGRKSFKS